MERLLKVTAFTVSVYSCVYRSFLPFRSPAGETGEIVAPDKGIRAIGEKARHKQHTVTSRVTCTGLTRVAAILLKEQTPLLRWSHPIRASGPLARR